MFDMEDGSNALTTLTANGASINAYTSTDITAYHFECAEKFSGNLETLLTFVSKPFFTPDSVDKEQGIIGQEICMVEDDPDYCLYYGLMKSLFRCNPLRDPVAGTVESITQISAEMLYDCHRVFYNPSNMVLSVAGDVDPSEIFDMAQRILPEEQREIPERDYGPRESLQPETSFFSKEMDVSLPLFLAGCKAEPAGYGPDSLRLELTSALALEILAGHSSPLFFRLYAEGLVNSDFSASFDSAAGSAYTMFGGESREPERVFDEVKQEIITLSEAGPDAALFGRVKKAAIGSQIRALNSFGTICGSIAGGFFKGYNAFEAPGILSEITEGDVASFFRECLLPDNMALSVILPNR